MNWNRGLAAVAFKAVRGLNMGMYDTVMVPCPKCGAKYVAQSKSGPQLLECYDLEECPINILQDVNRHAPFVCDKCGAVFVVSGVGSPFTEETGQEG